MGQNIVDLLQTNFCQHPKLHLKFVWFIRYIDNKKTPVPSWKIIVHQSLGSIPGQNLMSNWLQMFQKFLECAQKYLL